MALVRQQKLLSFTAGLAVAGASYVSTQRLIWSSTSALADERPNAPPRAEPQQPAQPMLGASERAYFVRKWNQGVDSVFQPIVSALSRRGL
ncbi:hypothetical protein ABBQ38_001338 [Trebouxia sp. C0009 RCD-2024]